VIFDYVCGLYDCELSSLALGTLLASRVVN